MTNAEKGLIGEKFVADYMSQQGYSVTKSDQNGSDLIAIKNSQSITIEVKTTSNLAGGIPDMHTTEFYAKDGVWYFIADYLYIVRLDSNAKPTQLDIASRAEIDQYADSHKTVTRVRTTKLDKAIYQGNIGKTIKLR